MDTDTAVLTVTPKAARKAHALAEKEGRPDAALRLRVVAGGGALRGVVLDLGRRRRTRSGPRRRAGRTGHRARRRLGRSAWPRLGRRAISSCPWHPKRPPRGTTFP